MVLLCFNGLYLGPLFFFNLGVDIWVPGYYNKRVSNKGVYYMTTNYDRIDALLASFDKSPANNAEFKLSAKSHAKRTVLSKRRPFVLPLRLK